MELLPNTNPSRRTIHNLLNTPTQQSQTTVPNLNTKTGKLLLEYFENILESSSTSTKSTERSAEVERQARQLFVLKSIEQLYSSRIINKLDMAQTIPKLDSIAQLSESAEVRFGAGWLSGFLQQNPENNCQKLPQLKLSADSLTVRNDSDDYVPVKSAFAALSTFAYYEVTLHTAGSSRIGWCSGASEFNKYLLVGDDEFSIGYEASTSARFWNEKNCYTIKNSKPWQAGDVVGCGIDVRSRKLCFFLNGKPIHKKRLAKFDFSSRDYFAAVSVGTGQQLEFNFGAKPFVFTPEGFEPDFLDRFQANNYLLEPVLTYGTYWFKYQEMSQDFNDYKQKGYCQWITDLELRIQVEDFDREFFQNDFRWQFEFLIKQKRGCERFIFEIIRSLGQLVSEDKLNVVTGWLVHYLCFIDETLGPELQDNVAEIRYMDRIQFDSDGNSFTVPSLAKLLELLYPFLCLNPNEDEECQRLVRNTMIVLNILASKYPGVPDFFNAELAKFYLETLNSSTDSSTVLYALTALEYYQIDQELKPVLRDAVERILELTSDDAEDSTTQEIHFVANWCLNRIFCEFSTISSQKSALDHMSATVDIKLVNNEARSDFGWQSVRARQNITSGVFYYEVTLLTSGSMRIGWATDDCDFSKTIVGDNTESVGIDMYRRNVFNSTKFKLKNAQEVWCSGDVVGCRINIEAQKFQFYLNGELIESKKSFFKKIVFSSSRSYRPAVTLSPFQQVRFNFGETPFLYSPTSTK